MPAHISRNVPSAENSLFMSVDGMNSVLAMHHTKWDVYAFMTMNEEWDCTGDTTEIAAKMVVIVEEAV